VRLFQIVFGMPFFFFVAKKKKKTHTHTKEINCKIHYHMLKLFCFAIKKKKKKCLKTTRLDTHNGQKVNTLPVVLVEAIQVVLVNYWIRKDQVDMTVRQHQATDVVLTMSRLHLNPHSSISRNSTAHSNTKTTGRMSLRNDTTLRRQQLKQLSLFQLLCFTFSNLDATTIFFNRLTYEHSVENGLGRIYTVHTYTYMYIYILYIFIYIYIYTYMYCNYKARQHRQINVALIEFVQFYHWCSDTFYKQWSQFILSKSSKNKSENKGLVIFGKYDDENDEDEDEYDDDDEYDNDENENGEKEKIEEQFPRQLSDKQEDSIQITLHKLTPEMKGRKEGGGGGSAMLCVPEMVATTSSSPIPLEDKVSSEVEDTDMEIIMNLEHDARNGGENGTKKSNEKIEPQVKQSNENHDHEFAMVDDPLMLPGKQKRMESMDEFKMWPEKLQLKESKQSQESFTTATASLDHGFQLPIAQQSVSMIRQNFIPKHFEITGKYAGHSHMESEPMTNDSFHLHQFLDRSFTNTLWREKISRIHFSSKIPLSKINHIRYNDTLYRQFSHSSPQRLILETVFQNSLYKNHFLQLCQLKYHLLFSKYLQRNVANYELNIPDALARECHKLNDFIAHCHNETDFIQFLIPVLSKIIAELIDLLNDSMARFRATHDFRTKMHKFDPEN
ncbi:hypothetical protein RFI_17493, partial [Reticulomyxa filosa]